MTTHRSKTAEVKGGTVYEREYFFDCVRASLFRGKLTQSQVDGMNYILESWEKYFPFKLTEHLAYVLATTFHETAQTMRPIEEYGKGAGYAYGKPTGPYNKVYYGRGHVQLTWEDNYKKATQKIVPYGLEADLHKQPERALDDEISVVVMFDGMGDGWFTGKKLSDYLTSSKEDPVNARRVVNGTDKAQTIADYYWKFKEALKPVPEEVPDVSDGPQMPDPKVTTVDITVEADAPIRLVVNGMEI